MNKQKIFMIISIIILILSIIGLVGTYAWYVWNTTDDDKTNIVTNIGAATVYYDAGSEINAILSPTATKEEGALKTINIKTDSTNTIMFNLYLDITSLDEGLKDESFIYELYKGEELVKEGNFSDEYLSSNLVTCTNNNTSHIVLLTDEVISSTVTTYTLYLWIDGVNYDNPNSMQNANFSFELHADGEKAMIKEGLIPDINDISNMQGTLAYKLISDYYYAEKETVTNNGVVYYYDRENNLMSDTDGNIRYYGVSPNNYVYFNCETYPDTNCELWRIIGVFDGNLKIMRNDSIGGYSYDTNPSSIDPHGRGSAYWYKADLMKLLNDGYSDNQDTNKAGETILVNNSLYYNSGSGICYTNSANTTGSCDFTSTGLKNDETRNIISKSKWYINNVGVEQITYYSDQTYALETTGTSIWEGEIALASAADYGYAADLSKCTVMLNSYNNSNCTSNNWMYKKIAFHFITAGSNRISNNYCATSGAVAGLSSISNASNGYQVLPTLYLDSQLLINSGDGSSETPYTLSLS